VKFPREYVEQPDDGLWQSIDERIVQLLRDLGDAVKRVTKRLALLRAVATERARQRSDQMRVGDETRVPKPFGLGDRRLDDRQ